MSKEEVTKKSKLYDKLHKLLDNKENSDFIITALCNWMNTEELKEFLEFLEDE